jgi:hypothetical protein
VRPRTGEGEVNAVEVDADAGRLVGSETSRRTLRSARCSTRPIRARPEDRKEVLLAEVETQTADVELPRLGQELPAGERPVDVPEHHLDRRTTRSSRAEARRG